MLNFINIIVCSSSSPNFSEDEFPNRSDGETAMDYFLRLLVYHGYDSELIPPLHEYINEKIQKNLNRKSEIELQYLCKPVFVDEEILNKYSILCNPKTKKNISDLYSDICKGKDKKPEDNHNKKLKDLISYIENTYWRGNMPKKAKKAVILMNMAIENDKLFIYMISYSIFATSGLKYLKENSDKYYKSRGVLHIRGETNYRIAEEVTDYDFLYAPSKLGSYKKKAIIGSVAVYENIAKRTNITELTFEDSVRMMEQKEGLPENHVFGPDKTKWLLRVKIYNTVKKIMDEKSNSSSLDEIVRTDPSENRQNSRISSIISWLSCFR